MRKAIVSAVLSAAVSGVPFLLPARAAAQPAGGPATQPATAQAQVPVRQVVLFSSGVGYFEHYGTVSGSGSTELRFKTAQVNDILKSLVLQDLDKGRITTITYPSQDPVAKTLRSFQIDITANPGLAELLNQLRGARVTVGFGAERVGGTVLGAEKKPRPMGKGDDARVVEVWFVNLLVGGGSIRSVPLDEVRDVVLEDPQLQEELAKALAALASARDQDKKPITINFQGQGDRRVRIGYVIEAPVWKTSYRLVLSGPGPAAPGQPAPGPAPAPAPQPPGAGAAQPGQGGSLQGWAIVENQTDNDWADVQLSLVSGRPISFIQDLYQPLYIPRPVVQPELYASLRPQTYDDAIADRAPAEKFDADAKERKTGGMGGAGNAPAAARARGLEQLAKRADGERLEAGYAADLKSAIDPTASVNSIASAAKVGELFQYTVGAVSLPRQKSAMIPIITDAVEVERLSIYNMTVLPKNPLNGARVKNTTGKHLLNGPVTVLDGGTYAGDARIEDLPPGQERLISYGVDQQVTVQAQNNKQESAIQTGKIVKGVLHIQRKLTATQEYLAENKADHAKTLIVEHPRRGGGWKLVEPAKANETTDALYRFKDSLDPAKPKQLMVKEEVVTGETIAILPADVGQLDFYSRTGEIPKPVRDALLTAIGHKNAMVDVQRQLQERQQRIAQITQEQTRLRENMKTVAPSTDYYNRLLKKLDEQETTIEAFQKEVQSLQKDFEQKRKALEDYLSSLNVA